MEKDLPPEFQLLARRREADMLATVADTIEKVLMWDAEGYPCTPNTSNCKGCALNPLNGGNCNEAYLPQLT